MSGPDPYVNRTGTPSFPLPLASKERALPNGTVVLTTSYQLLMRENALRTSFAIEAMQANIGNVMVRFGSDGNEYEILPAGMFYRTNKTGSVFKGEIYIKSTQAGDTFTAEES